MALVAQTISFEEVIAVQHLPKPYQWTLVGAVGIFLLSLTAIQLCHKGI